jgi:cell division septum initiation protein DivIVA
MAEPDGPGLRASIAALVNLGKDLVALLRDASLLLLAVLLLAFPARFNDLLVAAGFKEGSVAGFKWQANLDDSNDALKAAQDTISELQRKNDELAKTLTEAGARVAEGDAQLKKQIVAAQAGSQQLSERVGSVQMRVDENLIANAPLLSKSVAAKPAPAVPPPVTATSPRHYIVGVQALGFDPAVRGALNDKLQAAGYTLSSLSADYTVRPNWFAPRSTVFYYDTEALPAAKELAGWLAHETGVRFAVQRGAGLGVDPEQRAQTLYVHYLRGD